MTRFAIISPTPKVTMDSNNDIANVYRDFGDYELIAYSNNQYHICEYINRRPGLKSDIDDGYSMVVEAKFNSNCEFVRWAGTTLSYSHGPIDDNYKIAVIESKDKRNLEFLTTYEFMDIYEYLFDTIVNSYSRLSYARAYGVACKRLINLSSYMIDMIDSLYLGRFLNHIITMIFDVLVETDKENITKTVDIDTVGFIRSMGGVEKTQSHINIPF